MFPTNSFDVLHLGESQYSLNSRFLVNLHLIFEENSILFPVYSKIVLSNPCSRNFK